MIPKGDEGIAFVKTFLWFCPVCQGKLEQHPLNEQRMSCFVHGDFVIQKNPEGFVTVRWDFILPRKAS
jgi:hypothetical protein